MWRARGSILAEAIDMTKFPPDAWFTRRISADLICAYREIFWHFGMNSVYVWSLEQKLGRDSAAPGNLLAYFATAMYQAAKEVVREREAEDEATLTADNPLCGISSDREAPSDTAPVAARASEPTHWHTNRAARDLSPTLNSVSREGGGPALPESRLERREAGSQGAPAVSLVTQERYAVDTGTDDDPFERRRLARDTVFSHRRNEQPASLTAGMPTSNEINMQLLLNRLRRGELQVSDIPPGDTSFIQPSAFAPVRTHVSDSGTGPTVIHGAPTAQTSMVHPDHLSEDDVRTPRRRATRSNSSLGHG